MISEIFNPSKKYHICSSIQSEKVSPFPRIHRRHNPHLRSFHSIACHRRMFFISFQLWGNLRINFDEIREREKTLRRMKKKTSSVWPITTLSKSEGGKGFAWRQTEQKKIWKGIHTYTALSCIQWSHFSFSRQPTFSTINQLFTR